MDLFNFIFSPTGTSAKIAKAVAAGINATNHCVATVCDTTYRALETTKLSNNAIAIIAAPVYGGKMAPIAKERMKLIIADRTPCILIAVYGNRAFENALNDMAEFAEKSGFIPIGAAAFIGEHSYSTAETPIAVGRPDKVDLDAAEAFGKKIGHKLTNNTINRISTTALIDQPSPEESLKNFRDFVMRYMSQQKEAPKQYLPEVNMQICNKCGTCIGICPTSAISNDIHTVDPTKCIKCCACVKSCPEGARSFHSPFAPTLSANFNQRKSPVTILG